MADLDWRVWLKTKVDALAGTTGVPAARVKAAGSADENVKVRPFIVIKAGLEIPGPFPGVSTRFASLWVHDDPGTYMTIDSILKVLKEGLDGQVLDVGGVSCRWAGDSQELADDLFKTITRNISFQLQGKG